MALDELRLTMDPTVTVRVAPAGGGVGASGRSRTRTPVDASTSDADVLRRRGSAGSADLACESRVIAAAMKEAWRPMRVGAP